MDTVVPHFCCSPLPLEATAPDSSVKICWNSRYFGWCQSRVCTAKWLIYDARFRSHLTLDDQEDSLWPVLHLQVWRKVVCRFAWAHLPVLYQPHRFSRLPPLADAKCFGDLRHRQRICLTLLSHTFPPHPFFYGRASKHPFRGRSFVCYNFNTRQYTSLCRFGLSHHCAVCLSLMHGSFKHPTQQRNIFGASVQPRYPGKSRYPAQTL